MISHNSISRRSVVSGGALLTVPLGCFDQAARLNFDDADFHTIRRAIKGHLTANSLICELGDCDSRRAKALHQFEETSAVCTMLATDVFNTPALTVRDVFLRAEMLTLHYGDGMIFELTQDDCPAHRMLGGMLEAAWKVGGAHNV